MKRAIVAGIASILLLASCYRGHGLSPPAETSGIEGLITFIGAWPDSTKEVRIAVLKYYPQGMMDPDSLLQFAISNLSALSDPLPMGVDHHDYQFNLDSGHYAWILVVWLPENLFGIKELGAYYQDPNDLTLPTPITVLSGEILQGIDIVADFANVHNEKPFFKRERMP
jgi:hypothetical protein